MSRAAESPLSRYKKWAGLWMGAFAWFADQQVVATTAYARCPEHSDRFVVTVGVLCALFALAGGLLSLTARRSVARDLHARADRFIATLSVLLACVSLLAIVFGTSAGLILRCER